MGSGFELICRDLAFPESPRWHQGHLYLAEKRAGRVLAIAASGSKRTVAEIEGEPGGLGWTPDGDLLVVAMARRRVVRVDRVGQQHLYADLSSITTCKCNDMIVDAHGNAYVGDFGYDLPAGAPPAPGVLALARPNGSATIVATDIHFPNGCAITLDGELIVAESAANRLTAFRIEDDGALTGRRTFADLDEAVPDGICLDADGAVWIADPLHNAVLRVADGGEVLDRRDTGQGAFACELGGDDGHTLFVCTYDAAASASPIPRPVGRVLVTHVEVPRALSTELVTPVRELADDDDQSHPVAGGPPRYFALSEPIPGVLLAGTCGRGVARSLDGGSVWTVVGDVFAGANVNGLTVGRDGELYAAAGDAGLAVSYDDGVSWSAIECGGVSVYCVASAGRELLVGTTWGVIARGGDGRWAPVVDGPACDVYRLLPLADGSIAAATERAGVWLGAAAGGWQPIGLDDVSVFALIELGDGNLLAGTRGRGVTRWSRDAGWREVAGQPADSVVHAIARRHDGSLVAGTGQGVVTAAADGERWEPLGSELAHHRIFAALVRSDGSLLAASYDGVWAWNTGADDWSPVDTGLDVGAVFAIAVRDGVAYAGGRAGVFRSTDRGDTWQQIRPAELGGNAYTFCLSGGDLFVGTDDGVWCAGSGAPGEAWHRAGLDDLRVYTLIETEPAELMAGTLGSGVWKRPGKDQPWHRCTGLDAPLAFDLLRSPSTGDVFVAAGTIVDGGKSGGVYRSPDGEHWDSAQLEPNTVYDVLELSTGVILAGAQRSRILRSNDAGRTFVTTRPRDREEAKVYSLSRGVGDTVYLGAGAELLRSDDAGDSWDVVSRGLDGVTVYGVAVLDDGTLLAATSSGVYRSSDSAVSWTPVNWNV